MNISFISAIFVSNEKVDVIYNSVFCEPIKSIAKCSKQFGNHSNLSIKVANIGVASGHVMHSLFSKNNLKTKVAAL